MKKGGGSAKGSDFERLVCKQLSLWWSDGKNDDIFWRTAGSGARATNRAKQAKSTVAGHGDILAYHSDGEPLLRLFCFELKRGYNFDLLCLLKGTKGDIKTFWEQTVRSAENAGSDYPALIWKPDRQPCLFFAPYHFSQRLQQYAGRSAIPRLRLRIGANDVACWLFEDFLNDNDISMIKLLAHGMKAYEPFTL